MPVDVEVDSEAIELVAELRPVEVDVDSEATVLLVVDSPVDNELTPLCAVLMPDEAEVESEGRSSYSPSSSRSKSTWTAKRRCYWWSTARWTTN
ncbi:tash protein pest motif family [Burkholderia pseudomallei]|nr:tash protein pest motif family [Burkholderia pseudomallei]